MTPEAESAFGNLHPDGNFEDNMKRFVCSAGGTEEIDEEESHD